MEAIKETIKNVMQSWGQGKQAAVTDPEQLLKKILTKKELAHIKFSYFRAGILGINVDSSSWLYKFSLQKETLLEKLSKKISSIKDIRFRIGEIR